MAAIRPVGKPSFYYWKNPSIEPIAMSEKGLKSNKNMYYWGSNRQASIHPLPQTARETTTPTPLHRIPEIETETTISAPVQPITPATVHPIPPIKREATTPAATAIATSQPPPFDSIVTQKDEEITQQPPLDITAGGSTEHAEANQKGVVLIESRFYKAATVGDVKPFQEVLQAQEGNERVAKLISPQQNSVLHVAASFGQLEVVKLIHQSCPGLIMKTNSRGDTPLHNAARDGHLRVVNYFIEQVVKYKGDIETGSVEILKGLLRMVNENENTALHEATKNGHSDVAHVLLNEDPESAKLVNKAGESPFYLAAEAGIKDLVSKLLGMEIDHMIHENKEGKTALHAAVAEGHNDILDILLEKKPELVESKDNRGRSALHYAAFSGYHHGVRHLLQSNASIVHHRDTDGMYPIHLAAVNGHINVMEDLLSHCPESRELLNTKDQNTLHVAVQSRKETLVRYIIGKPELEKLINERDEDGNTPLHLASIDGHAKIVSILVRDKRVDLSITNNDGMTAYEVAEVHADSEFSFRKILAAAALKSTSAPRRQRRLFFQRDIREHALNEKTSMENFKDRISTLVVVATLIITITFASGLTIPGDHDIDNPGRDEITNLLIRITVHIYVISNTLAMYTSIISAITLIWAHLGDINLLDFGLRWSMLLLAISLTMMAVAFSAGVYLVVSQLRWLAVVVLVMGFIFLVCILALFIPLQAPILPKHRWTRFISRFTFNFLLFATGPELRSFFE